MSFTVDSALRWWAAEMPDALALSVDGDESTFAALHDWSGRVAEWLAARGVRPGDRVAMAAINSIDYAALILGVLRVGAIGAPVSFRSTAGELAENFASTRPTLIFADADRIAAAKAAAGAAAVHDLAEIAALRHGAPSGFARDADPSAALFIINTSGSTGRPKGSVYTQYGVMTYLAEFVMMEPRCGRGSSLLSLGPFSSASGYLLMLQFLATGVTIHMESRFDPARALRLLSEKRITTLLGVPLFFERMAALPEFADADLSHLHFAQVAGARVNMALLEAWRRKGVTLRHAYGCTEAGGGWAARDDVAVADPGKAGKGGMFNRYAILGADGTLAPPDMPGEILIRGSAMMGGYWENPEQTCEAFHDGWFRTGDLGTIDAAGNVTIIDRLKDIIISGGLNIAATEIERVIAEVPGVEEVAVIAARDDEFGETPLAVVFGDAGLRATDVVAYCGARLARYKVPRFVEIVAEPLPRLPSGKISKPAIRDAYAAKVSTLERLERS